MNGRTRRVIVLTVAWMLVAAGLAVGGWWLGQRQLAGSGVTSAPSTSPPAVTTGPPAIGQPAPTTPKAAGTWRRMPAAPIPSGAYEFDGVWTGRELLLYGAVHDRQQALRAAGAAYTRPPTPGAGSRRHRAPCRRWRAATPRCGPAQSCW